MQYFASFCVSLGPRFNSLSALTKRKSVVIRRIDTVQIELLNSMGVITAKKQGDQGYFTLNVLAG